MSKKSSVVDQSQVDVKSHVSLVKSKMSKSIAQSKVLSKQLEELESEQEAAIISPLNEISK
jgi:uncharacterized protein (DUF169 family)